MLWKKASLPDEGQVEANQQLVQRCAESSTKLAHDCVRAGILGFASKQRTSYTLKGVGSQGQCVGWFFNVLDPLFATCHDILSSHVE